MAIEINNASLRGSVNLPSLVLSRVFTIAIFMTYPACLDALISEWQMSTTQAGIVQGSFTLSFSISLLVSSILCDRIGAKRVFRVSGILAALAALSFAFFARSFETGILFIALVGLSQGGTYIPAIILVSHNTAPNKKGSSVGWILAGMSLGHVVSIFTSATLISLYDYQAAFLGTAVMTLIGAFLGLHSTNNANDGAHPTPSSENSAYSVSMKRRARILTLGYVGHSWELFGVWAWIPAFLITANSLKGQISPIELGLWTALALHMSGFFASSMAGYLADFYGARKVLIGFALVGALCSLAIGWLPGMNMTLLLVVTCIYGFSTIGDSSVLSSEMTNAVPAHKLGKVLGIRSVLGMGVGSTAPVVFGGILEIVPGIMAWGFAFSILALGGMLATLCAFMLKEDQAH